MGTIPLGIVLPGTAWTWHLIHPWANVHVGPGLLATGLQGGSWAAG